MHYACLNLHEGEHLVDVGTRHCTYYKRDRESFRPQPHATTHYWTGRKELASESWHSRQFASLPMATLVAPPHLRDLTTSGTAPSFHHNNRLSTHRVHSHSASLLLGKSLHSFSSRNHVVQDCTAAVQPHGRCNFCLGQDSCGKLFSHSQRTIEALRSYE